MSELVHGIYLFYSNHSEVSKQALSISMQLDFVKNISIDNKTIRNAILNSKKIKLKGVPTLVVIYKNGKLDLFGGEKCMNWLNEQFLILYPPYSEEQKETYVENIMENEDEPKRENHPPPQDEGDFTNENRENMVESMRKQLEVPNSSSGNRDGSSTILARKMLSERENEEEDRSSRKTITEQTLERMEKKSTKKLGNTKINIMGDKHPKRQNKKEKSLQTFDYSASMDGRDDGDQDPSAKGRSKIINLDDE